MIHLILSDQFTRTLRKSKVFRWAMALILVAVTQSMPPVQAKVRLTPLGEMIGVAGTVVSGKVLDVRGGVHPDYPNIEVTFVTLYLEETFKTIEPLSSQLTFMQFGGMDVTRVQELPSFKTGESVLLFLYPKSQYGFTSPVGGGQGKFVLRRDPASGALRISNEMSNWKLFSDIRTDRGNFSTLEKRALKSERGAADYSTFKSILGKLINKSAQ